MITYELSISKCWTMIHRCEKILCEWHKELIRRPVLTLDDGNMTEWTVHLWLMGHSSENILNLSDKPCFWSTLADHNFAWQKKISMCRWQKVHSLDCKWGWKQNEDAVVIWRFEHISRKFFKRIVWDKLSMSSGCSKTSLVTTKSSICDSYFKDRWPWYSSRGYQVSKYSSSNWMGKRPSPKYVVVFFSFEWNKVHVDRK